MGLLDLPAPWLDWADARFASVLPPLARLLVWGVLAGAVSMLLYRVLSPQARIGRGKREVSAARRALDAHEGSLEQAWPLIRHLLHVALRQVGRTAWPAVIASVPVLCVLAWLGTAYGYRYPAPAQTPRLETAPARLSAQWRDGRPPQVLVHDGARQVAAVALDAPVPLVHKRRWWNVLLGNPAGYLPADGPLERLRIGLPPRHYLAFGPHWLRGWAAAFFLALVTASIALKVLARIE